jgi:chaperonin GroES
MHGMKVVPLNDKILLKRVEAEDKTTGGILLPDSAKEKPRQGTILSLGEGKRLENGSRAPFQVKVNDRVLFSSYAGNEITVDGEEYLIMTEDDVLAVVS